jgi:hypothetical protein
MYLCVLVNVRWASDWIPYCSSVHLVFVNQILAFGHQSAWSEKSSDASFKKETISYWYRDRSENTRQFDFFVFYANKILWGSKSNKDQSRWGSVSVSFFDYIVSLSTRYNTEECQTVCYDLSKQQVFQHSLLIVFDKNTKFN